MEWHTSISLSSSSDHSHSSRVDIHGVVVMHGGSPQRKGSAIVDEVEVCSHPWHEAAGRRQSLAP